MTLKTHLLPQMNHSPIQKPNYCSAFIQAHKQVHIYTNIHKQGIFWASIHIGGRVALVFIPLTHNNSQLWTSLLIFSNATGPEIKISSHIYQSITLNTQDQISVSTKCFYKFYALLKTHRINKLWNKFQFNNARLGFSQILN